MFMDYLQKIEDERQLEAIKKINEQPNQSLLYILYKLLKKE